MHTDVKFSLFSFIIMFLFQFCRLHQQRLLSTRGSGFNVETAGFRRPRSAHHNRPDHFVLVSDQWGEETRQPQTATGAEVRLWAEMFYFLVCVREAKLQLKRLFLFLQGQRGRFRNRLGRTGQHGVAHFRDPRNNRVIDWHFALGRTNGPWPVGSYRHCLVQSHFCCSTCTVLDYKTLLQSHKMFTQHQILSSHFFSQISKALLFI